MINAKSKDKIKNKFFIRTRIVIQTKICFITRHIVRCQYCLLTKLSIFYFQFAILCFFRYVPVLPQNYDVFLKQIYFSFPIVRSRNFKSVNFLITLPIIFCTKNAASWIWVSHRNLLDFNTCDQFLLIICEFEFQPILINCYKITWFTIRNLEIILWCTCHSQNHC